MIWSQPSCCVYSQLLVLNTFMHSPACAVTTTKLPSLGVRACINAMQLMRMPPIIYDTCWVLIKPQHTPGGA